MDLTITTQDATVVIEPAGLIDARASQDFERQVLAHLATGSRHVIIDLAKVDILTGAGIRVLMLIAKRLQAVEGSLVLCALSDQMRSAFDVAGLGQQFQFVAARAEAIAQLSASAGGSRGPARSTSTLSRLTARLLEETDERRRIDPADVPSVADRSELARRVATLLAADEITPP